MPGAALTICEEIKTLSDHSAYAYYYAGMACIRLGLTNQAITNLKEAVRREPENASFHSALAVAYSNQGAFPWARRARKQALREESRLRAETAPEWQRQMAYGKLAETEGRWGPCAYLLPPRPARVSRPAVRADLHRASLEPSEALGGSAGRAARRG